MLRFQPLGIGRKALYALLVVALSFATAVALVEPASAAPPVGPTNGGNVTLTASPVDGLAPGQAITYTVNTSGGTALFSVKAHICRTGDAPASWNGTNFGYSGSSGVRCVATAAPAAILSGGLTGGNYEKDNPFSGTETTSGPLTFNAGTGTVSWVNETGHGPNTLTCDSANPCSLVIKVDLAGGTVPTTFFVQQLTYAAAPTVPTGITATAGNGQVTVGWTPPSVGAPFSSYTVHNVAPGAGGPNVSAGGAATSVVVGSLTNFTQYCFTVDATNGVGTGPTSTPSVCATPGPPGPLTVNAAPRDGAVDLTWSAATGTVIAYRITVVPTPGPGTCATGTCTSSGAGTGPFAVTGLTNGTTYTFTVAAQYAGGFSAGTSATAAPNGALIRQGIAVIRPEGVLVISQYCSFYPSNVPLDPSNPGPRDINGRFDPSNSGSTTVPNTLCNLQLSGPRTSRLFNDTITSIGRTVYDAVTNGTTTITSTTVLFTANDLNQIVTGTGIPNNTRIQSVTNGTTAILTNAATTVFDGGELTIAGNTVNFGTIAGNTITPSATSTFAAGDVNKEVEGVQIPGGSYITGVFAPTVIDISSPANNAASGTTVREWTVAPTPAHLITTGPHRGQYLEATGKIRQVTVVDTRPADTGWTATGQVSNFCNATPVCFNGDNLGWSPKTITAFSQPFTAPGLPTYTMTPAKGATVQPGTNFGLGTGSTTSTDTLVPGSKPGQTLAYTFPGQGLGLAQLDADLDLWIPVQKPAGTYNAVLTFTAI